VKTVSDKVINTALYITTKNNFARSADCTLHHRRRRRSSANNVID